MNRPSGRPQQPVNPFSQMLFGHKQPPVQQHPNYMHPHQGGRPQQPNSMFNGGGGSNFGFFPSQHSGYQQPFQGQHQGHPGQMPPQQYGGFKKGQGMPPTKKPSKTGELLKHFQTEDGNLDYMKIGNSMQQVYGIYGQVSPYVKKLSPLISSFIKK